ncbi:MMPL family transporter [Jidongwangia harbinensis]|uniref:MMPL family transporter n=1 Tax=Jidongwangia harbinensis TaxID=2878561 RepID=UPI001CD9E0E2|nr:MMPL family transporter [Jidongwangia harbinensis]MCA2211633.1 MMPL family transporter [Jidongwangia harbinensis]
MLGAALALAVLGGAAGPVLFDRLTVGGFDHAGGESARAAAALRETFGQSAPNLVVLVTDPRGVDDPAVTAAGTELTRRLAAEPGVSSVVSYWTSGNAPQMRASSGQRALVLATIDGSETQVDRRVTELAPRYRDAAGLDVQVGGYAVLQHEMTEQAQEDATFGESIVFPVTLVVLVLVFGSAVAASLPLLVALATVLLGMGTIWLLTTMTTLSVFSVNIVTLLGLGLAIDYSLLMVNRYREELHAGDGRDNAIRRMLGSAGRTIVYSAATVAVALACLAWFPILAIRSMAYAGVATAVLSAAASLIILPAILVVLGPRVERGRLFGYRGLLGDAGQSSGFWHRLASMVMRRPLPVALAVTAFFLLLGTPALGMNLALPDERVMGEESVARDVAATVRAEFDTGEQNALQIVLPAAPDRAAVAEYAGRLSGLPGAARVDTVTGSYQSGAQVVPAGAAHQGFAAGGAVYLQVVPRSEAADDGADLVRAVRATPEPGPILVGGLAATGIDTNAALAERLPAALATLTVAMIILLFLLTGSVLLPVLALVLSVLSLTATFGALVWIFQDGHLAGLFGDFTVTGTISSTLPIMLFALSFGLAMDYQVFLLSRIREEYELTGSNTAAVAQGLERVGGIVTAAAVLISIVFLAFVFSDITFAKAFGIGLPLAVLMDATLVRGALLPATMRLGGRLTWWAPGPLRRLHASIGLRESSAPRAEPVGAGAPTSPVS